MLRTRRTAVLQAATADDDAGGQAERPVRPAGRAVRGRPRPRRAAPDLEALGRSASSRAGCGGAVRSGPRAGPPAFLLLLAFLGAACGGTGIPAELHAVPPPDLARLPDPLRQQVGSRWEALTGRIEGGAPAGELARAYGDAGLILMAAEFEEAALACLRNAEALAPDDPRWPYYLGRFHLLRGEQAQAPAPFERAYALRPTDVPTLVQLGELYLDQGRPDDAAARFREALAIDPRSAAGLWGLGRAFLAGDAPAQAARQLEQALALAPEAGRVHYSLARAYERLGDARRAAEHLERRGSGAPSVADPLMDAYRGLLESALAYHNRGFEAFGAGRWAEAAEAFRAGLALEPDNVAIRHTLGTVLHQMGDVGAAVREFEALLRIEPSHTQALFSLAVILASEGRYDEARRGFEAAIEHEPDYVQARLALAELLQGLGRPEDALSQYEAVVEVDPRRVEAWIDGANVRIGLDRYGDADAWLRAARQVHPDVADLAALHETVEAVRAVRRGLR